jgi:hypothetical protein
MLFKKTKQKIHKKKIFALDVETANKNKTFICASIIGKTKYGNDYLFKSKNKEDMIKNIPFWKVIKQSGNVVGAMLYKDKNGRKRVATCTDGSRTAKKYLAQAILQEPSRAFFEVSKKSWEFTRKQFNQDDLISFMKNPVEAALALNKELIDLVDIPVKILDAASLNPNDPANKPYEEFIYGRKIGGKVQAKVLVGTIGKEFF